MNSQTPHLRLACLVNSLAIGVIWICTLPDASAQNPKRNPMSKIYVSDLQGEADLQTTDKIIELSKKSVHLAEGVVIETKKPAETAERGKNFSSMVFSNGTGIYFDPATRLEVKKFQQEPFRPNRTDMEMEPSISQTETFLSHGLVGLCSSRLAAGSSMLYQTPYGSVNVRGHKIVIEATDQYTHVAMLEGESTVRGGSGSGIELGGQTLHAGEEAYIRPGSVGHSPSVQVQRIPQNELGTLEDKVSLACMAKKTVYFEVAERRTGGDEAATGPVTAFNGKGGDDEQEIVPVEVVPADLPTQFTVSPARLGPG